MIMIKLINIGLKEQPFKCNKCETSFKRKRTFVHHVNHECGVAFICTVCKQYFKTKGSLRVHLFSVHMIDRCELPILLPTCKLKTLKFTHHTKLTFFNVKDTWSNP